MPAPLRLSSTIFCFLCFGALLAIAAWQPEHKPDPIAYDRCVRIHPQRHCKIVHLEAR